MVISPHNPDHVAVSMVSAWVFETRAVNSGKCIEGEILIWNFRNPHYSDPIAKLHCPVECTAICYHPYNPQYLIAGLING